MTGPLRRNVGLFAVAAGTAIAPLDTAVNIAFPWIVGEFGRPMASIQWVIVCYVLTYASLMLAFGKLGDLFGHRRVFAAGLVASVAALLLVSVSQSFGALLFFRFLQGLGSGLVTAVGPALVMSLYPEERRGRAAGMFTLIFAVASMLGPSVGGMLVEWFDWRAVFWFRAPIALVALGLLFALPAPERRARRPRYDFAGAAALVAATVAFLLALDQLRGLGERGPLPALGLALVCALAAAAFVRAERRAEEPILKLDAFRDLEFAVVNLTSCLVYLAGFAVVLLIPFLLPRIEGLPAGAGGLLLATGFAGAGLAAPLGGRLLSAVPAGRLALAGAAATGAGLFAVGRAGAEWEPAWLLAALFVQGVGTGLFQVSYLYIVTGKLPPAERGVAGSLAMLTRTIGVVTAASVLTLAFVALEAGARDAGLGEAEGFAAAFRGAFELAGGGLLVFLLATMVRPRVWLGRRGGGA